MVETGGKQNSSTYSLGWNLAIFDVVKKILSNY